jgi:hypothetical protein
MKMARLCVAALMSSWALEIHSFAISSSRTFRLFLFSFDDMLAVADESVTAGMLWEEKKRGQRKVGDRIFSAGCAKIGYRSGRCVR